MKARTTLFALLSTFVFYGCVKVDPWVDTTTHDNILYNGYLKFTANGVKVENTGSGFSSGGNNGVGMVRESADTSFTTAKSHYTIFSGNSPGTREANGGPFNIMELEIYTDSLQVGTYVVKQSQDIEKASGHVMYVGKDLILFENESNAFTIDITKHSHGVLEGTFSGSLFDQNGHSMRIDNGAFSCGTLYK